MPTMNEPIPTTIIEMLDLNKAMTAKAKIQPKRTETPSQIRLRLRAMVNIKMPKISTIAKEMERKLSFLICCALVTAMVGAPTAVTRTSGCSASVCSTTLLISSTICALPLVSLPENGDEKKAKPMSPRSLNRYSSSTR